MKKVLVLFVFLFSLGMTAQTKVSDSIREPLALNIKLNYPMGFGVDLEELKIESILLTRKLVSQEYLNTLPFKKQMEIRNNSRYLKLINTTFKKHKFNGKIYRFDTFIDYNAFNGLTLPYEIKKNVYPISG